jgi:hypothetical protein
VKAEACLVSAPRAAVAAAAVIRETTAVKELRLAVRLTRMNTNLCFLTNEKPA